MTNTAQRWLRKDVIMAITISTLVALAPLYLGFVGPFLAVFIPVPILFYRSKLGRSSGLLILAAVILIVTTLVGNNSWSTAAFLFELGLVGLVLPEAFEMNLSIEKTVGITAGVVLVTGAVILALYSLVSTSGISAAISDYVAESANLALAMYKEMEVSQESVEALAQSIDGLVYVMLRIIPATAVAGTLFVIWSNLLLARFFLGTRKLFFPDFGRLNHWRAPEPLVWAAIASGILLVLDQPWLRMLGINGLIVMMMIYFFQGIAIVSFYFKKKQFPRALRVILYGLIALQQLLLLVVAAVGFFDMWIDFRRTRKVES